MKAARQQRPTPISKAAARHKRLLLWLTAIVVLGLALYVASKPFAPDFVVKRKADSGDPLAQTLYYTRLFEESGASSPEALKYLKLAVDQGFPEADFIYGMLLITGKDVPADFEAAMSHLKRASDHGHEPAQRLYAECLKVGMGIPIDKEAIRKMSRGADPKIAT
jgi:TPR repeat protein